MTENSQPVAMERRVRGLMDDHERLLSVLVVSETEQGYYALVVRDWDHPSDAIDADILAERYAYLTKGQGNDGWVTEQKTVAINRRDVHDDGDLAAGIATMYAKVSARQRADGDHSPHVDSLVDGEE